MNKEATGAAGSGTAGPSPLARLNNWSVPLDLVIGRLAGVGLLVWMAWIHWHLWSTGYKHLHVVGPLFLANAVGGVLVALAVLAVPSRWLSLTAGAGALMAGGTLAGLAISINIGLFGFKDFLNAPFARLSVWVESAALVVLAFVAIRAALVGRRQKSSWSRM
jgi:hypothetical protein